jgi:uncharacterized LabA/DUF88 family protein
MTGNPERTIVFIDGNNWFHGLVQAGVSDRYMLDYTKISNKIIGARQWVGTRYYIGQVRQEDNREQYADQRSFLARICTDKRVKAYFGRLEPRTVQNELAKQLKSYLAGLAVKIDPRVYHHLVQMAELHKQSRVVVEKAVDVMLAVDLVVMAERNEYDTAYILAADGDYTPAVHHAKGLGKKIFAASTLHGAELAKAVYKFIPLNADWFKDCY